MKPHFVLVLSLLLALPGQARPAQGSIQADGFHIEVLRGEVSVTPVGDDLEEVGGGPFFVRIELAKSAKALENPSKRTAITQGIAPGVADRLPIVVSLPPKRTRMFRVSAKGIIEMKRKKAEQVVAPPVPSSEGEEDSNHE